MTIRRGEHSCNYAQIPNETLNDDRLSFEALGCLTYLLSKPEDWTVQIGDICSQGRIGRDKCYRILKELEETGYLERQQTRQEAGRLSATEMVIHDLPISSASPRAEKPYPELPYTDSPDTENPTHTKTINNTKTKNSNGQAAARSPLSAEQEAKFEQFWDIYPRRVKKARAKSEFKRALGKVEFAAILTACRAYAELIQARKTEEKFIAHPAQWLKDERWDDEDLSGATAEQKAPNRYQRIAAQYQAAE